MVEKIEKVLDVKVRPYLSEHYGDIKLIGYKDGVVEVKMLGGCSGCPSAKFTVEEVVETNLRSEISEIQKVCIINEVSDEVWAMAKKILNKEM